METHIFKDRYPSSTTDPPLAVRRMIEQNETFPHEHVFYEIVYIESGTGEHITVDGVRSLQAGDVIVIRPRMWHQYVNPQALRLVNCLFDRSLLNRCGEFLSRSPSIFAMFLRRIPQLRLKAPTILHAGTSERAHLEKCLNRMLEELTAHSPGWEAAGVAWFTNFIVGVSRLGALPDVCEPILSSRARDAVNDVSAYLETHYTEMPTLEALAARVHLSPEYLCRAFTQRMGVSIVTHLHQIRIEEACRLLRHTDCPITDVAGQVGYNELAYFSRRFRKELGQSPRQYRAAKGGVVMGVEHGRLGSRA